ncbi:MAG: DNA polymerase III subunit gamma/tau, partial [Bacillota bacterium]
MAFLSLYRKYRPKQFSDLVGQEQVVQTLKNSIKFERISHAYLFAGPRGTGKTSTAKVYARALNCLEDDGIEPCGHCENCKRIDNEQSMDLIEIDAASNRGIEAIRELREKVKFYPGEGRYKIYIIDEVHMLTNQAFNALLKTLEEPPEKVIFILATTEPHKVIPTILSRCQRFDFSLLTQQEIAGRLEYICQEEDIEYEKEALNLIAYSSSGGMRDAISLLDQAISYSGKNISLDQIEEMLGRVKVKTLSRFVNYLAENDTA